MNNILAIDLGSSAITTAIAKLDNENNINILGTGIQVSRGIEKGLIINIEDASKSIKDAVEMAKKSSNEQIDTTVVSVSGAYSKSHRSTGSVNVPNGLISETEINQVMQMALYNATIVPDYEVVHVVPMFFKVDDSVEVDNPLNMNGTRLEVSVNIVMSKRTALTNIKSSLRNSGIDDVKFVLDSYASALAVLDEQQKKFGAVVVNMGSTATEFVYYKGNSIIYNGFIPVGSNHITRDLSIMLHTPPNAAENIKLEYGSLVKNYSETDENEDRKVKTPRIGDENSTNEIGLDSIQTIIHARVEEILILVRNKLKKNALLDSTGSGIVLTGGLTYLDGIKDLARRVFEGIPISVSAPKPIINSFDVNFDEAYMSTIAGLLEYSLGKNRSYQLDSSKKIIRTNQKYRPLINTNMDINPNKGTQEREIPYGAKDGGMDLTHLVKEKKKEGIGKIFKKVTEWF